MGLEFAHQNPRAAVEAVFEQFPTVASNLGPELGTTSLLQQDNVFRGDMDKRQGWGWHDMASWQTFFDGIHKLGQITNAGQGRGRLHQRTDRRPPTTSTTPRSRPTPTPTSCADAFAAIDVDDIKAHMFDQAIKG